METGNIEFKRAIYLHNANNLNKTTIDYKLENSLEFINEPLFTEIIRLEQDNGFHDRSRDFDYWLYFRDETNWQRCARTGLAKTKHCNLFEGNISRELNLTTTTSKGKNFETPHHLVIVQSNDLQISLTVDIFKDFYITKKEILKYFIKDHNTKHGITKKSL
ncbi:hypothetical protein [Bizionia sp.]|uniref:hypothetical protein n=1 Tax=Bizionia sp. TaxID=1954480 RepID=UPI003A95AFF5